jgi:hypothetical protein
MRPKWKSNRNTDNLVFTEFKAFSSKRKLKSPIKAPAKDDLRQLQLHITELFGVIEYFPDYNYKTLRRRPRILWR